MPSRSRGSRNPRHALAHTSGAAHRTAASLPNPAVIEQAVQLLYGPNSQNPMTPTPAEVHRQTFVARWIGQYTVGSTPFLGPGQHDTRLRCLGRIQSVFEG